MFKFIALFSCFVLCSLGYDVAKHPEHSHRLVHVNAPPPHYDVPIKYVTAQQLSETKHIPVQQLEYTSVEHPEAHVEFYHAVEQPEYTHVPEHTAYEQPHHEHIQITHPHHEADHSHDHHYQQAPAAHEHIQITHPHHEHHYQDHVHHHEGHSNPHDAHAEIKSSESLFKSNGEYAFGFDTTNGIAKHESGLAGHSVKGGSQHYTPEGELVTLKYVADENGFHAVGSHIPTPPPLPKHVIETLAWNAAHPEEEEEDHSYDHEDYHHGHYDHHDPHAHYDHHDPHAHYDHHEHHDHQEHHDHHGYEADHHHYQHYTHSDH